MLLSFTTVFKLFWVIALLSIFSTAFRAKAIAGVTVPLPQTTQSTETIKSKISVPICYMETANGKILDLSSLCKQSTNFRNRSNPSSFSPYNSSAIKKFDDELYEKGNQSLQWRRW